MSATVTVDGVVDSSDGGLLSLADCVLAALFSTILGVVTGCDEALELAVSGVLGPRRGLRRTGEFGICIPCSTLFHKHEQISQKVRNKSVGLTAEVCV